MKPVTSQSDKGGDGSLCNRKDVTASIHHDKEENARHKQSRQNWIIL